VEAQSESKLHVTVQTPTVAPLASSLVQKSPAAQWLRPGAGEQPSTHLWLTASQTRAESGAPQSASALQPQ
jgi:hypothetical protein